MTSGVGGLGDVEHDWLVRMVVTWFQTPRWQYSTRPSPAALCTGVVRLLALAVAVRTAVCDQAGRQETGDRVVAGRNGRKQSMGLLPQGVQR